MLYIHIITNLVHNENDRSFVRRMNMELGFIVLLVTILCAAAVVRSFKSQNMFATAFAGIATLVFGFFSIATLYWELIHPLFQS